MEVSHLLLRCFSTVLNVCLRRVFGFMAYSDSCSQCLALVTRCCKLLSCVAEVTDANMSFSTWEQTVASWEVVVDKSIVARESEYSN